MTDNNLVASLQQLDAFSGCSEETLQSIETSYKRISFSTGHSLTTNAVIPDRVLIILSGRARLLAWENQKPVTIALIGPGSFVGLASLLRAEACEEVCAMEPLEALSIPDAVIAKLYSTEKSFKQWCQATLFPAELASFLTALLQQSEHNPFAVSEVIGKVMHYAKAQTECFK